PGRGPALLATQYNERQYRCIEGSSNEAGEPMASEQARAGEVERAENMARSAVVLREGGQATVTQVAHQIGTSRPPVAAALGDLAARGLVIESPVRTAGGRGAGRPEIGRAHV